MAELDKLYRIGLENAFLAKDLTKRRMFETLELALKTSAKKSKQPFTLLYGLRGTGKTTLLLQLLNSHDKSFYFSADSFLIKVGSIYEVAEQAYRQGYETLLIDEIHKYSGWADELKNIYDDFSIPVVASGSSAIAIRKGSIKLGRRAVGLELAPLTFAEHLHLKEGTLPTAAWNDFADRKATVRWLAANQGISKHYREYLETGGFPSGSSRNEVFRNIKKMIYEDALAEFLLSQNKVDISEKLLGFLASSMPGEFSYTSFCSTSGYGKSSLYDVITMMREIAILRAIEEDSAKARANSAVKLLFSHPNLRAAVCEQLMQEPGIGAMREEYFLFHVSALGLQFSLPKRMKKTPDYLVKKNNRNMHFEIGGHLKSNSQIREIEGNLIDDDSLMVLGCVQETDRK